MIMQDQVKRVDRMNIPMEPLLVDYANHECVGCGRTSEEIAVEDDCDDFAFDKYSVHTNSGHWYCHEDCYRDSH